MAIHYIYPDYEIVRDLNRCIKCKVCQRQCANEVHEYDESLDIMVADNTKCVNCHRCVSLCPTRALKIVKTDHTFRENGNWSGEAIKEIYRQAESGGVLLSSMGNPAKYPVYWDKMLINASQVTNPSIDPLREPMETKVFLGKKNAEIKRDAKGNLITETSPQLELQVPIMFSAMSYGSISYNAHESLARAAQELRADFTKTSINMVRIPLYRSPPDALAYIRIILKQARPLKSKWVRGQNRESAATFREAKL